MNTDIIAAIATPPGKGGVGIIRISGLKIAIETIANKILKTLPPPRKAFYTKFYNQNNEVLDIGIALYFPEPYSFTGETILELQGHGGNILLDLLLQEIIILGARLAKPGEFSQRAFLNNKLDLSQAEAIADLIDSSSVVAAKAALRSLQGDFSKAIEKLSKMLLDLRIWVEASLDFPEEEIEIISEQAIFNKLQLLIEQLIFIEKKAEQGTLLKEGMYLVIVGMPNAGKSSLLNALSERETAIVTPIAGTTRDVLKEMIVIDGLPIHLIDTAGLRQSEDIVEQEGMRRAWQEIHKADRILWVIDDSLDKAQQEQLPEALPEHIAITKVYNKADISKGAIGFRTQNAIGISVKENQGLNILKQHLKDCVGYQMQETPFMARRRHLEILNITKQHLLLAKNYFSPLQAEFIAEELLLAHNKLGEITGKITSDDLLGEIFGSFCIGK